MQHCPSLQKKSSELNKWISYRSLIYPRDMVRSMPEMSEQQLLLNLIQLNLIAYYNPDVLQMIEYKMTQTSFYLRNRHLLQNLVNTFSRQKGLNQKIKQICKRFDQIYVNGDQYSNTQVQHKKNQTNQLSDQEQQTQKHKFQNQNQQFLKTQPSFKQAPFKQAQQSQRLHIGESEDLPIQKQSQLSTKEVRQQRKHLEISKKKQDQLLKHNRSKQYRANFISRREDFILALDQISDKLFYSKDGKTEQEIHSNKQQLFMEEIMEINRKIEEQEQIKSTSSTDSTQIVKQASTQGLSEQEQEQFDAINFQATRGYSFYFKSQYHSVDQILLQRSHFIITKNRSPLVLDFGFSRFIYKNDDQLAHQLIAMQLIKYLNKIFGKKYIQEYQIIPEIKGALYEFVEGASTVASIKKDHKDLLEYFRYISVKNNVDLETLQKKFAQSYAGYCMAEFLLQIKDRNNANIMVGQDGTFFHIDLAFIFNSKPGGISFETAPFKMTKEYVKVLNGFGSDVFKYFQSLLIQMMTRLFESREQFLYKLEILSARSKQIRCFNGFEMANYKENKMLKDLTKTRSFVQDLVDRSYDNWNTKKYDSYQLKVNNIPV